MNKVASAKKCDRCGRYYEPEATGNIGKTTAEKLQHVNVIELSICSMDYQHRVKTIDFCPACMDKQIKFLQGAEISEQSGIVHCKECNAYTETGPGTGVCPALGGVTEDDGCTMGDRKESAQ